MPIYWVKGIMVEALIGCLIAFENYIMPLEAM